MSWQLLYLRTTRFASALVRHQHATAGRGSPLTLAGYRRKCAFPPTLEARSTASQAAQSAVHPIAWKQGRHVQCSRTERPLGYHL